MARQNETKQQIQFRRGDSFDLQGLLYMKSTLAGGAFHKRFMARPNTLHNISMQGQRGVIPSWGGPSWKL
jgi:hypothetical protein